MIKNFFSIIIILGAFTFLLAIFSNFSFSRKSVNFYGTVDTDLRLLESSLEQYRELNGQYPTEKQGLQALVTRPNTEPFPEQWIQLLPEILRDPWNTPFRYHFPGLQNLEKPEIISAGPDSEFGTVDDASNQD